MNVNRVVEGSMASESGGQLRVVIEKGKIGAG